MVDSLEVVSSTDWSSVVASQQSMLDSLKATNMAMQAQQASINSQIAYQSFSLNNLWVLLASALVFIMHLGFATLESGLTRSKNTINILFKNTFIPLIGLFGFCFCGFGLMFPDFPADSLAILGFKGFGLEIPENGITPEYSPYFTYYTKYLFQGMFAATCATIVSGAVAERIKLNSFMVFSLIFVSLIYPIIASWEWGEGWLSRLGFHDFAGSTLVHSVGGWAALAGVIVLGPRLGKFEHGKIMPIQGHSMTSAVIGVFLLWLGWFGFNGGSVLSADPGMVSMVIVNTNLAACMGGLLATIAIKIIAKKYDLTMTLNGILSGLVAITAGADKMSVTDSVIIGSIAGILVVLAVLFFDRIKIDDPVGAISVHLVCGIWGTIAVGLFGNMASTTQIGSQLIGVAAAGVTAFLGALLIFVILKYSIGLRVTKDEEIYGLDYAEHGMEAYPDFVSK